MSLGQITMSIENLLSVKGNTITNPKIVLNFYFLICKKKVQIFPKFSTRFARPNISLVFFFLADYTHLEYRPTCIYAFIKYQSNIYIYISNSIIHNF